ncbi:hypothetical protein EV426DRAFT_700438 [Tirmania nivea]|nr:hypothetical protein EV426DRAFT_700438 [Tirmania nivea]
MLKLLIHCSTHGRAHGHAALPLKRNSCELITPLHQLLQAFRKNSNFYKTSLVDMSTPTPTQFDEDISRELDSAMKYCTYVAQSRVDFIASEIWKAEKSRKEKERVEKERLEKEKERVEKERLEKEKLE